MSTKFGNIIVLNGTSSSGKTCILQALQEMLEEPYLNAGIDKFIWMMPARYLERPLWDDVLGLANKAGATGHQLISGMHQAIAALSKNGCHVLADHVLVEPAWPRECARLFAGLPAWLIGIHCPLEVLEQREKTRKNRTLGQARAQFDPVHAHGVYDLEVDTSVLSPTECAVQIRERILAGSPQAFKTISDRERIGKTEPVFQKVDCIRLYVPDLEAGLAFYRDQLGHPLIWRAEKEAGLRLPGSEAELVLQTENPGLEVDLLVKSAEAAAAQWVAAGGKIIVQPFDIRIGRCVVVEDPWSNSLVLLDSSKGLLLTDSTGKIIGNKKPIIE